MRKIKFHLNLAVTVKKASRDKEFRELFQKEIYIEKAQNAINDATIHLRDDGPNRYKILTYLSTAAQLIENFHEMPGKKPAINGLDVLISHLCQGDINKDNLLIHMEFVTRFLKSYHMNNKQMIDRFYQTRYHPPKGQLLSMSEYTATRRP